MKHFAIERLLGLFAAALLALASSCSQQNQAPPAATMDSTDSNAIATAMLAHLRAETNRCLLPTGQLITPAGQQVRLPKLRPQALALSPDGRLLVTAGKTNGLVVMDPATGRILQLVSLATNKAEIKQTPVEEISPEFLAETETKTNTPSPADGSAQLSFTGLTFASDGKRLYFANVGHNVRVFEVGKDHQLGAPRAFAIPPAKAPHQNHEIPCGLAVSEDGARLYVAGNLGNRLHELDTVAGKPLRSWKTGVAPFDVVLVGNKAYVSNLGGRRPEQDDLTGPAGKGMSVRVDATRRIASEGSVTVIDLAEGKVKTEILVELHASALAVSPDKKYVVVANTGSDTLSVIDTQTDRVVEKIWARQTPADPFGAQPNALAFDRSGKRLFVCNGTQNAVAVVAFEPEDNASWVVGLIPVGWFPGAVKFDAARKTLCVANIKGAGANRLFKPADPVKYNSKDYFGTVSLVPLPSDPELAAMTEIALENMSYPRLAEAKLPPRADQPARPVPERVGEPSVFKHVLYIIKENRTYDQVLGDLKEGNGDTNLCTFGEKYTPNQHKLAREFVLLDNTYCAGVQSADGHQWTDSAIANAYMERQVTASFPRSYPGGKLEDGLDALGYSSSGFLWDHALAHGKTFRNYGEWMLTQAGWRKPSTNHVYWTNYYNDYLNGTDAMQLRSKPGIATLAKISNTNTVGWDLHVPDVLRAAAFIKELRQFEDSGGFPQITLLFLPNDHTGGAKERYPVPGSQLADNDLAFGQVVEAVSHSRFWPETCIFAIEDDPQMGWDHVSGYRTTCYVASPYTKRRQTLSTHFNQTSLLRTMEMIVGLPPMNQMDATATPMTECFTDTPDLTPFTSVTNTYPLDRINPNPKKIADRTLRNDAMVSAKLPLDEPDRCNEDILNRILWRSMKGPDAPYPEWAVKAVAEND